MLRFLLPRHVQSEERDDPRAVPGGCAELVPAAAQPHHLPHPGQPQPGRGEGDRPPTGRSSLSSRGSRHTHTPGATSEEQNCHLVIIIIIVIIIIVITIIML